MSGMYLDIFVRVILPILVMVGLGALVQRFYPLHVPTLSRLNIYLFVPAFLFIRIYESQLTFGEIGGIALGTLAPMVLLGLLLYGVLRRRGATGPTVAAVVIGGLVYNAGNFGLPVAELLYQGEALLFPGMNAQADGPAVQALVVMMSNLTVWCLGYAVLAMAKGEGVRGALGYFKLPMIYVVIAAFALRHWNVPLPAWLEYPLRSVAVGLVPVALITLGAQLGVRARWPRWTVIGPVMAMKLAALPAVTALVAWATNLLPWPGLHLWPWPGAQLVIAAAAPTAVNTLLLTMELDGDADLAADCVFWTTLASAITVTATISVLLTITH